METTSVDAQALPDGTKSLAEFVELLHQDPPQSSTGTIEDVVRGIRRDRDSSND